MDLVLSGVVVFPRFFAAAVVFPKYLFYKVLRQTRYCLLFLLQRLWVWRLSDVVVWFFM